MQPPIKRCLSALLSSFLGLSLLQCTGTPAPVAPSTTAAPPPVAPAMATPPPAASTSITPPPVAPPPPLASTSPAPASVSAEHCGGIACTSLANCTAHPPVCANLATISCPTQAPRECVYSLKISASCPCLEHDVRLCDFGGSPGVQICTASGSTTAWADCIACPSCTP